MKCELPGRWLPMLRCNERDVIEAFRATATGIRALLQMAENGMDRQSAAYIAGRLYEQRELIRQVMTHNKWKHVRIMVRIHRNQKRRFIGRMGTSGVDASALALQCRIRFPAFPEKNESAKLVDE
ncbi:MAG: hypothetical protein PHX87_00480 [Candidatus Peribacteraceae bacterium]|nr:hypothetical protein [Candidatus Peribacteraceae bacterium]MDD5741884.1 hypothetical protein [Candidatus Peribacteraceae bacterium]